MRNYPLIACYAALRFAGAALAGKDAIAATTSLALCHCRILILKIQQSTLFKDNLLSQFYFPGLFSLLHIHTWWGQSKYVRKFEISRANFEKTQNLFILKNFLGILCNNVQNCSISKKLRHKSFENLQTISKLVQECLN